MKSFTLLLLLLCFSYNKTNAQTKIDFSKDFPTIIYRNTSTGMNGLESESFSGRYRIYDHVGSLRMGLKFTELKNYSRIYTYKGKKYSSSQIPEINNIEITKVSGVLKISNGGLSESEKKRNVEVFIGGYLDQSGSVGGNNIEITNKLPTSFSKETHIEFIPTSISFDASEVHLAIEKYLEKEKEKNGEKENLDKYNKLLLEARNLFSAQNYDHALSKYYDASYINVKDKQKAEEGIVLTRKKIEEEAEEDKNKKSAEPQDPSSHTYKDGECKLSGVTSASYTCPLCRQEDKKEKDAKTKEDKRVEMVKAVKAEQERKTKEAENKRIAEQKREKERIEAENKTKELNRLAEEKELRRKIENRFKDVTKLKEIDFSKVEIFYESDNSIIKYDNIELGIIPKNKYVDVYKINGTYFLSARIVNTDMYEVLDIFGNAILGLRNNYYILDEGQDEIRFYIYKSQPEFFRQVIVKAYGESEHTKMKRIFYDNKSKAIEAIESYIEPKGTFTGYDHKLYIVQVDMIKTDLTMKIIEKKEGYAIK
ncbi:cell envelope integrity protein TolA [Chryseobacterium oryzae]|uniref:Uncharacterized protein n=1 Tax=Chryseobacterium oryzae TaxID=2929799 RepID=A0ABY4BKH3_9FLAO|nr:cell envelope integrity protein TolA [Chryseobacterium oryzae]UOE38396.1 hypothetical protein MTP08_01065 [Chryseobacterium oryzae]